MEWKNMMQQNANSAIKIKQIYVQNADGDQKHNAKFQNNSYEIIYVNNRHEKEIIVCMAAGICTCMQRYLKQDMKRYTVI